MKALSIQVQPDRAPELDLEAARSALEAISRLAPLVQRYAFDEGYDERPYLNFTYGTNDLQGLWREIESTVYRRPALGQYLAAASIVTCQGNDGWNDYLLLHHFDPSVRLDGL